MMNVNSNAGKFLAEQNLLQSLNKPRIPHKKIIPGREMKELASSWTKEEMKKFRSDSMVNSKTKLSDEEIMEVRRLHHLKINQEDPVSNYSKIKANALDKRDRHDAAIKQYNNKVKEIGDVLELKVIQCSELLKEKLAAVDEEIKATIQKLKDSAVLVSWNHSQIVESWVNLKKICSGRTNSINNLLDILEEIEMERTNQVGKIELVKMAESLVDTAHMLPAEIERIVEKYAYELNVVLISNRKAHADLKARLLEADVHVYVKTRISWEECEQKWRKICHSNAIKVFIELINSVEYTNPPDREHLVEQLSTEQQDRHVNTRMTIFDDLCNLVRAKSLTVADVDRISTRIVDLQKQEDERNQFFFQSLQDCHNKRMSDILVLKESLRKQLHVFGAHAKEGDLENSGIKLSSFLKRDEKTLEEFFRMSGTLKPELIYIAENGAQKAKLIYSNEILSLLPRLNIIISSLNLNNIMEKLGKTSERKSLQLTIEKVRKASKSQIPQLLPSLANQIELLLKVVKSDEFKKSRKLKLFSGEIEDIHEKITEVISGHDEKEGSFSNVDLQNVRKVQRRLSCLIYATDLSDEIKSSLSDIHVALKLQLKANKVVDDIIEQECANIIESRKTEGLKFLTTAGRELETQGTKLHEICEGFTKFFKCIAEMLEFHHNQLEDIDWKVNDVLETLKQSYEAINRNNEQNFKECEANVRHAPDETVLDDGFKKCLDSLSVIEGTYRNYNDKVNLISDNHPKAVECEEVRHLNIICREFGLISPYSDKETEFEHLLNVEFGDDTEDSVVVETSNDSSKISNVDDASGRVSSPLFEKFRSYNNSSYDAHLSNEDLVKQIIKPSYWQHKKMKEKKCKLDGKSEVDGEIEANDSEQDVDENPNSSDVEADNHVKKSSPRNQSSIFTFPIERVIKNINIPVKNLAYVLNLLKKTVLTEQEDKKNAKLDVVNSSSKMKKTEIAEWLEEKLRCHWPRKGKADVMIYQPREGELVTHRQRQERYIRNMSKKLKNQDEKYLASINDYKALFKKFSNGLIGLQAQLPMQLSLAALQGLDEKEKQLVIEFRSESQKYLSRLKVMSEDEPSCLFQTCDEFVTQCRHNLFPDLSSSDVVPGCDYHPTEVKMVQKAMDEFKVKLNENIKERKDHLEELAHLTSSMEETRSDFKKRYKSCLQDLSMKEGLGQKYGAPRRNAQERLRSAMATAEHESISINSILSKLDSLPDISDADVRDVVSITTAAEIYTLLRDLIQKCRDRAEYFDFLKRSENPSENTFRIILKNLEDNCREETKELFRLEDKEHELPNSGSGTPESLEIYLSEQHDRAENYREQECLKTREQITHLEEIMCKVPKLAMYSIYFEAYMKAKKGSAQIRQTFEAQYKILEEEKANHQKNLTPDMCSKNKIDQVAKLSEVEMKRSKTAIDLILENEYKLLLNDENHSKQFETTLVQTFNQMIELLNSAITKNELDSLPGDENIIPKRKSLKRLRKALHKKNTSPVEEGQPERRNWNGIPSFNTMSTADIRVSLLNASSTIADESNREDIEGTEANDDGACSTILTIHHRHAVRGRDECHQKYVQFFKTSVEGICKEFELLHQDEKLWQINWKHMTEGMQQDV